MLRIGLATVVFFSLGCNRDMRESVKHANEGIKLYKEGQFGAAEKALAKATEILP